MFNPNSNLKSKSERFNWNWNSNSKTYIYGSVIQDRQTNFFPFLIKIQGAYWGDHDWQVDDEDDAIARKAYEALLRVSLLQPTSPRFQDFADTVRQRAQTDYNYSFSEGEEVLAFLLAYKYRIKITKLINI